MATHMLRQLLHFVTSTTIPTAHQATVQNVFTTTHHERVCLNAATVVLRQLIHFNHQHLLRLQTT
jgi:hypothetical protein